MTVDTLIAQAEAVHRGMFERHPWIEELHIVGVGWATVELDRAERELADVGCPGWRQASRDDLLGASVRRCADRGLPLLLLEPDTEGRLAASLARHGEGVAAVYLGWIREPAARPGPAILSRPSSGPLGPARLLLGGPPWGRHVIVLEGEAA